MCISQVILIFIYILNNCSCTGTFSARHDISYTMYSIFGVLIGLNQVQIYPSSNSLSVVLGVVYPFEKAPCLSEKQTGPRVSL